MKKLIIASTSTIHGTDYLEYLLPTLKMFFTGIDELLFIPYARPSGITHDAYTKLVATTFVKIGIEVKGLHQFNDARKAVKNAQAIFVGGGNTFVLVDELYKHDIINVLQEKINAGTPYLGTSAGSNICGMTMQNTNDMPIVYPPSYETLGVIPFNINAHYIDPDPTSTHRGETRETRIKEFHTYNEIPVLGLREGSWLEVTCEEVVLKGKLKARWFVRDKEPIELNTNSVINTSLL